MDFGLCRYFENDEKKYLRPKIMYRPIFYWYMIVSDFILRYVWLVALFQYGDPSKPFNRINSISIIMITCECFRRAQWALLRVENEQCNNFEQYRTIPIIPPIIEKDEEEKKKI